MMSWMLLSRVISLIGSYPALASSIDVFIECYSVTTWSLGPSQVIVPIAEQINESFLCRDITIKTRIR